MKIIYKIGLLVIVVGLFFAWRNKNITSPAIVESPYNLQLTGDIQIHDPMIIRSGNIYYSFSSGQNILVKTSTDLLHWTAAGEIFDGTPARPKWFTELVPGSTALWAPDVSFFGGVYHLYYAVSTDRSTRSCIGHAISGDITGDFIDQGPVVCSNVDSQDNFNAIDPNIILDEKGIPWLSFGSYLGGIQIIKLTAAGVRADGQVHTIAARTLKDGVVEAPFIVKIGSFYYLFTSWDSCCKGIRSTYNIRVGRSQSILGPYADKGGKSLLNGGGTAIHTISSRWRGPGHNAILNANGKIYNVYHAYDAANNGEATLRISELVLDAQGWPVLSSP